MIHNDLKPCGSEGHSCDEHWMIPPPSPKRSNVASRDETAGSPAGDDLLDGALQVEEGEELLVPTEPGDSPTSDVEVVVDLQLEVPTQIADV